MDQKVVENELDKLKSSVSASEQFATKLVDSDKLLEAARAEMEF